MFLDPVVWLARAEGMRGQRGLAQWELTSERPAGPCGARRRLCLPSPGSTVSSCRVGGRVCIGRGQCWGGGDQVLLPSPWGLWLECWGPRQVRGSRQQPRLASTTEAAPHGPGPSWPWPPCRALSSGWTQTLQEREVPKPRRMQAASRLPLSPPLGRVTFLSAGLMMPRDCLSPLSLCLCCFIGQG